MKITIICNYWMARGETLLCFGNHLGGHINYSSCSFNRIVTPGLGNDTFDKGTGCWLDYYLQTMFTFAGISLGLHNVQIQILGSFQWAQFILNLIGEYPPPMCICGQQDTWQGQPIRGTRHCSKTTSTFNDGMVIIYI